jgi:hypothetical protein
MFPFHRVQVFLLRITFVLGYFVALRVASRFGLNPSVFLGCVILFIISKPPYQQTPISTNPQGIEHNAISQMVYL